MGNSRCWLCSWTIITRKACRSNLRTLLKQEVAKAEEKPAEEDKAGVRGGGRGGRRRRSKWVFLEERIEYG